MKRLLTLGFMMVLTTMALSASHMQIAYAQKPIRWDAYPNPCLMAADRTRNFQVGILNTYATEGATFTVMVTVVAHANYFSVTNPTQTGTLNPAAWRELIFPISSSSDVPVGVYADEILVSLDYTIAGASYQDSFRATIEIRIVKRDEWRAQLQAWEQEMAAKLRAWKEEVVTQLSPSLQVSASPSSTDVSAGESLDVTVLVNNVGTGPAKSVVLTLTPTEAFSLRTAATITIEAIDAGDSEQRTFGLTARDNASPGSYSPAVSYEYKNALAHSMGIPTAETGTTTFTVSIKEIPFVERYMNLIIVGVVAIVIIVVVVALARR